ncbi:D-alanyl-D-alanine carboxypeptidase [Rhizobium sp. P32RR-XVIII]|nr:D-alanyl-D-alanine carboxypeptidase [Rhizobium sp. P32RR-XVIII]
MSRSVSFVPSPRSGNFLFKILAVVAIATTAFLAESVTAEAEAANPKYAGIVVDAKTGNVLYSENSDRLQYPASLTKMMTLYMVFEALEQGRIRLDTRVPFSAHASAQAPTKLGVKAGNSITVEQGILGLVTLSANDAATALGELLGGSEDRFGQMMTAKAHALGMTRTTYRNANGLPNTAQMTTARDQARLGIALRQHFPQYYAYFSTRSFKFGNRIIRSHNRLVGSVRGVDGIKTGYTRAAGFNLVSSVQVDGKSIVGVVMGGTSTPARDSQMRKLIAAYLPKASTRGGSNLIAEKAPTPAADASVATADVDLPHKGPTPDTRYEVASAAVAYTDSPAQSSENPLVAQQKPEIPAPTKVKTTSFKQASVAVPSPAPAYMPPEQAASDPVDAVTTASVAPQPAAAKRVLSAEQEPSGWVVQIGVSSSRDMAMDLLEKAKSKGGKALRSAKPFAVAYSNGGDQIYRARFGGFDDQREAVNACNALKRTGVKCWASAQ